MCLARLSFGSVIPWVIALSASAVFAAAPKPPLEAVRFLKGQTHAHTSNSDDSRTPPEDAARWYARHGFDFVVFTDHNFVTHPPSPESMLVIPGIELTQNLRACDPPPPPGLSCLLHVNALFVDPLRKLELPSMHRASESTSTTAR